MRITMLMTPVTVLGTTFKANLWILVPADQIPVLSKMTKGGEITATGDLTRLEVDHTPEGLKLVGDLRHAKLETR
jgi:hypothetical protein